MRKREKEMLRFTVPGGINGQETDSKRIKTDQNGQDPVRFVSAFEKKSTCPFCVRFLSVHTARDERFRDNGFVLKFVKIDGRLTGEIEVPPDLKYQNPTCQLVR